MDKIEELRRERARLASRLKVVDEAIAAYAAWETAASAALGSDPSLRTQHEPEAHVAQQTQKRAATPMAEFTREAELVLREAERPLPRTSFLAALEDRGVVVGGADPRNTLSARLARLPDVINITGYGYWHKERPFPPAGYLSEERKSAEGFFDTPT
jgi:hypothetical protein